MVNILRFKFSDEVMQSIQTFAKTNKMLDRKDYKQEWNKWMQLNERMVNEEIDRINNLGYNECVKDKMFKAGRYYFRKKNTDVSVQNVDVVMSETNNMPKANDVMSETNNMPKTDVVMSETNNMPNADVVVQETKKRQYIKLTNETLVIIDNHIKQNINNKDYTPANGHKQFCLNHIQLLKKEMVNIKMNNVDEFFEKIKKTYKNRYFIINQAINK
jgi:hypothetical protein